MTGIALALARMWIRKGDSELWKINRREDEEVLKLLETEIVPRPDGGFFYINEAMQVAPATPTETKPAVADTSLVVPSEITTAIANLVRAEKAAKDMKEQLRALMEKHGITKWECDDFVASIGSPSVNTTLDTAKFKAEHADLFKKYAKTTTRKGSFKITPK